MGLSQNEIDKLTGGKAPPSGEGIDNSSAVRGMYQDAFRTHLVNILGTLTGEEFTVERAGEDISPASGLSGLLKGEWFGFLGPLELTVLTPTAHLINLPITKFIVGKIMGQDTPAALDEAHIGTLKETATNLIGAWATGLSDLLSIEVKPSGEPDILKDDSVAAVVSAKGISGQEVTIWRYNIKAGESRGQYSVVIPSAQLKELVMAHPEYSAGPVGKASGRPGKHEIQVEKAVFQEFEGSAPMGETSQIQLLLDVPLTISVELGRKRLPIKDILEMVPGSLLELDKLAGEPVDLMVNGKLFARGEVVVIDENFGVRIANIVSPKERLERLK